MRWLLLVADEAEVSCVERRHYLLRSGLADGDTLTGPGADEHMPIAWPRDPDDPLPARPKGRRPHPTGPTTQRVTKS